jgi:hypothetical protein
VVSITLMVSSAPPDDARRVAAEVGGTARSSDKEAMTDAEIVVSSTENNMGWGCSEVGTWRDAPVRLLGRRLSAQRHLMHTLSKELKQAARGALGQMMELDRQRTFSAQPGSGNFVSSVAQPSGA